MRRLSPRIAIVSWLCFAVLSAAPGQEKAKVQRHVPSAKLESILEGMNIKYEKSAGKEKGVDFYDFQRNDVKVRLHNYQGKDLWIDVNFTDKIGLEEINNWNIRAKFSRAVQISGGDKSVTSLEAQLDCLGGVTDGMIRQFILRFDGEIKSFVQFLTK